MQLLLPVLLWENMYLTLPEATTMYNSIITPVIEIISGKNMYLQSQSANEDLIYFVISIVFAESSTEIRDSSADSSQLLTKDCYFWRCINSLINLDPTKATKCDGSGPKTFGSCVDYASLYLWTLGNLILLF